MAMALRRMSLRRGSVSSGAPSDATFIVQTPDARLPSAQALNTFAAGTILKVIAAGVLAAAVAGTDYVASAGVAGGQTINGGTAASENLTLVSTSNATKGQVRLGSSTGVVFDEANGLLGVGTVPLLNAGKVQINMGGGVEATAFSNIYGFCAFKTADLYVGVRETTNNIEAAIGASSSGGNRARMGALTNHDFEIFTNNVERARALATGEWVFSATVYGSQSASGSLTVASTTNATKGQVRFGSSTGFVFDESTGNLSLGQAATANRVDCTASGAVQYQFQTSSTTGTATLQAGSNSTSSRIKSYGGSTSGTTIMGLSDTGAGGLQISATGIGFVYTSSASDLVVGANNAEAFRITSANKQIQVAAVGIAANAAQTVTVGNVGPGAAGVSIQEWWQVRNAAGTLRYLPMFG